MMITYAMAFLFIPFDVAFYSGSRRLLASPLLATVISFIGESSSFALAAQTEPSGPKDRLVDIVCLMDVAINFRSSYQDRRTKRAVLEGRKIALRYIRFHFWVDLLSSFPDRIVATWVRIAQTLTTLMTSDRSATLQMTRRLFSAKVMNIQLELFALKHAAALTTIQFSDHSR